MKISRRKNSASAVPVPIMLMLPTHMAATPMEPSHSSLNHMGRRCSCSSGRDRKRCAITTR